MSAIEPTMLIVTSEWNDKKSFRLIPLSEQCPYNEGIYDPNLKVLVMMSSKTKQNFHFVPRLDDNGDPLVAKKPRPTGKKIQEQRVQLETFTEYYITDKKEIIYLIDKIAVNPENKTYLEIIGIDEAEPAKK